MDIDGYLARVKKNFGKTYKDDDVSLALNTVSKEPPPTGIVLDNPMLEYAFDRRFMAYGRCYLLYGKKGSAKTSFLFELAKIFQKNGGLVIWVETENAPDFRYMELQGVDPDRIVYHNPKTLNEALVLCKSLIMELKDADPTGETPVMIALDSIAGGSTDYEQDQDVIGDTKVGEHAKLMAGFYRNIIPHLEAERAVFVATNQLRDQIGGMTGFGQEKGEALIGGEAQRFNSTYQFKFARVSDITLPDHMGVKRKSGSEHQMTVKRNKLGREGNSQKVIYDLYINGGIDWYAPLVRFVAANYGSIIKKESGGWYTWKGGEAKTLITTDSGTVEGFIDPEKKFRDAELGVQIASSHDAKELIRKAFGIPDMPAPEEIKQIESSNRKKRKNRSDKDSDSEL